MKITHSVRSEKGSVLLLVVVALTAVMGIVGLAMDVGQLYVTKQTAQAAADSSALAAVMDLYNGTNIGTNAFGGATITAAQCEAGGADSGVTPCAYAQKNGFGVSAPEVTVAFGANCTSPPGVTLSASDAVNLICVTVSRVVSTTFMQVLGTTTSTVTATAEAAITSATSQIPLLITHPTLANSMSVGNTTVCGGPNIGVQVNSTSTTAASGAGVDLSKAGPTTGAACTGSGSEFRVVGGPTAKPAGVLVGSSAYIAHASAIADPLGTVPVPPKPVAAPATTTINTTGTNGCPSAPCTLYSPGLYATGIDIKQITALFKPGIYYITGGGFEFDTLGEMAMATGFTDGTGPAGTTTCTLAPCANTATGWTKNMLVYNTGGGTFNAKSNFGKSGNSGLTGSPTSSVYKGILFFQDRTAAGQVGHTLDGGGALFFDGAMYFATETCSPSMLANPVKCTTAANASNYQALTLGGHSSITIGPTNGGIVVDSLSNGGSSSIKIDISPATISGVRQVGLVQ